MKPAPLIHSCIRLLTNRFLAVLIVALSAPNAWAASIAQQAYLKASDTGPNSFGSSVSVSGDTVVVGYNAYVFVRNGTNWSHQSDLKASNTEAYDGFGGSLAVSGDTVVVGAWGEDSNATGINGNQGNNSVEDSGAAYVFLRTGTNWTQQAYLKASNTGVADIFGISVAVSGDTIIVGAYYEDSNATGINGNQSNNSVQDSGAAYVFVRNGTNWGQQAYLKASNTGANDWFGFSVASSGDIVVIGAPFEDSNANGVNGNQSNNSAVESGAAYVFVRNGTNWSQQAYLKAADSGAGNRFGWSVSVSGDTVVVGSINLTAYVFVRSGTNWSQQTGLKASNNGADFGFSVAVSGDTAVVGATTEASNATGVNGDQNDNSAWQSGAAYVFVRSGTNWNQQAYLKASNAEGGFPDPPYGDNFGYSVAVSGDTVLVGAPQEASNATGVNGDQSDNSLPAAGAAYVFTGLGVGSSLALAPDASGGYFIRFAGHAGATYQLQRAPSLTGPWPSIATNTSPASGLVEFHETNPPPGGAFYRTVSP